MKLTHPNCKNDRCSVCMADHTALRDELEERTGLSHVDHLGKYHEWLSKRGINPETEWGWATAEAFDDINITDYVNSWLE